MEETRFEEDDEVLIVRSHNGVIQDADVSSTYIREVITYEDGAIKSVSTYDENCLLIYAELINAWRHEWVRCDNDQSPYTIHSTLGDFYVAENRKGRHNGIIPWGMFDTIKPPNRDGFCDELTITFDWMTDHLPGTIC